MPTKPVRANGSDNAVSASTLSLDGHSQTFGGLTKREFASIEFTKAIIPTVGGDIKRVAALSVAMADALFDELAK